MCGPYPGIPCPGCVRTTTDQGRHFDLNCDLEHTLLREGWTRFNTMEGLPEERHKDKGHKVTSMRSWKPVTTEYRVQLKFKGVWAAPSFYDLRQHSLQGSQDHTTALMETRTHLNDQTKWKYLKKKNDENAPSLDFKWFCLPSQTLFSKASISQLMIGHQTDISVSWGSLIKNACVKWNFKWVHLDLLFI